ncbi:RNA helicase family protein [Rhynchospora pubera]|uniref:RNA helicase n=1 Tax=Rhynchospora pubera TaxID=906938 RepID=A0AAV8D770_9POAL|nr:RNA helicase family protein [Rhynchospora pubera]
MRPSSSYSNRHHWQERPYRPPDRYRRPCPPRQPYTLILVRKKPTSASAIETLIRACPDLPINSSVKPNGPLAAVMTYTNWVNAVRAATFFWQRRLAGSHCLTIKLNPPAEPGSPNFAEEMRQMAAVFSRHINSLLETHPALQRWEQRASELNSEIVKISRLLGARNGLAVFTELQARKKGLELEMDQVQSRLREFREAMDCILACLRQGTGMETEGDKVRIFKMGKQLDFEQLHSLITRECTRLEDGLPVYGCRTKILSQILANQVMVLIGETGSGKSTQLVQYLADSGIANDGSIVCTQPRKIAAISLAQRVSEEAAGCFTDNYVVAYPTYSSSQEFKSRVIFTTDHCLLQHCMNGSALDGISYILVDEAHERSLSTDLLLALIKNKLLERMDLRLIIMSATADASKLADYFYGCGTFHVSGRTFPVDIKYLPRVNGRETSGFASYVLDTIEAVANIHKSEGDGDILAFLTSQIEVEHACESFSDPRAVVLPMHGKLSAEEQSRVFKNYPGKRKIIFSTNIAETSLTIRGMKYVVDSGMMKESRYQPKNGMNVLRVTWITQSSANQRAGRAGRTAPGKCFRLYSEEDFYAMELHQEPEIRKVHLGTAVLRILALGVRDVHEFEFVDAPNPEAIDKAVENLVHLGAIIPRDDGYLLTATGESLVKLNIEPRLGKMILDCVACGLGKEGLVLAAVMANASSIFCRIGSDEEKLKADCLKIPFCHPDGDLFTLLSVYKKWEEEKGNGNKWCWENSINAKSMRRCQETVRELESCLKQEISTIIPTYWTWEPDRRTSHDKSLKRIILSCLVENLAVFSGYDKLGYQVALTGQNVQLHPSCSLLVFGKYPGWVAFGEILSSSNHYLICVTVVDYDDLCRLETPFDRQKIESSKLHMQPITGVANSVLKRFCGRSCQNLHRLISQFRNDCMDDRINIEVDFQGEEIQIFAMEKDLWEVYVSVSNALDREERWLQDECLERTLYPARGGPGGPPQVALIGSGGEIKHLELDKHYLTVEVFHPNAQTLVEKDLRCIIDQNVDGGIVSVHNMAGSGHVASTDPTKWGRLTFLTPDKAEYAVKILNDLEFEGAVLKAVPVHISPDHCNLPFPAVRATASWPRRPRKGIALVTCPIGEAPLIVRDLFLLAIRNRYVNCEVSTKRENCIFVRGIPWDASEKEIREAFHSATSRNILNIHVPRGPAMAQPSEATCAEALVREIREFMPDKNFPEKNFRVEVLTPGPDDYTMKARITFDGSLHLEAAKALDHLEGRVLPGCLPWQTIQCHHVFTTSITCSARVYNVVKDEVLSQLKGFELEKGITYKTEPNENGAFRVRVTASGTKIIADLRRMLERLMKGKTLDLSHPGLTPSLLHLVLTRDGINILRAVENATGTHILYDRQRLNLKIFGTTQKIEQAEKRLLDSLVQLHEQKQLEIKLKGLGRPPSLMKEVIRCFGADLGLLKLRAPETEFTLNTRRHVLYVRGSMDAKQRVEEAIAEVAASIGCCTGMMGQTSTDSNSCPICLCELDEPYKLESCGHTFCRTCLIDQFESAIRSREGFPLCCLKEGCRRLIILLDLKALLSNERIDELFRASLGYFVASNAATYRFCPTADCPSVYKVTSAHLDTEKLFVCGACYAETCRKCHLEYHPGVTCEQYMEYKADPDLSLTEWRKGRDNVRDCPAKCGFVVEKVDGCNHVACRCLKHVCWSCMAFFNTSEECYSHLRAVHEPILLDGLHIVDI